MTLVMDGETDEYETLPSGSVITHMIAGAIAGTAEHCVMYPLDSVKVQNNKYLYKNIYNYFEGID